MPAKSTPDSKVPADARKRFLQWHAWLELTGQELADKLGVCLSTVSQLRSGRMQPGRGLATSIQKASRGWPMGPIQPCEWEGCD